MKLYAQKYNNQNGKLVEQLGSFGIVHLDARKNPYSELRELIERERKQKELHNQNPAQYCAPCYMIQIRKGDLKQSRNLCQEIV
jgi:vacuolar-type H+-ATPase subunit I/STV1